MGHIHRDEVDQEKAADWKTDFLTGMIPQTPEGMTLAALIATGLAGGTLASMSSSKWDPSDVRKPNSMKVYVKKKKPLTKLAYVGPTEGLFAHLDNPFDWGDATGRLAMGVGAPLGAYGLYNLWSAMNEAREKAKLESKLKQLETGAVPQIVTKEASISDNSKCNFANAFIEKTADTWDELVKSVKEMGRSGADTLKSLAGLAPDLAGAASEGAKVISGKYFNLPGLYSKLYAPALGATIGTGGLLGYTLGRSQWKPKLPPVNDYREPSLEVQYVDPDTGEVWGGDENPSI